MQQHQEYPKIMVHPQHRPAVIAKWDPKEKDSRKQPQGEPVKFPQVVVHNKDQELYHASMGYQPNGVSDPEAYRKAMTGNATTPDNATREFPKWLYKVKDDGELDSKLVETPAQEKALGSGWHRTPDLAKAAQGTPEAGPAQDSAPAQDAPVEASKPTPKPNTLATHTAAGRDEEGAKLDAKAEKKVKKPKKSRK